MAGVAAVLAKAVAVVEGLAEAMIRTRTRTSVPEESAEEAGVAEKLAAAEEAELVAATEAVAATEMVHPRVGLGLFNS